MPDPINVLHIVHSLEAGGLENGVVNLANRLDPARFHHTILCLTRSGSLAGRISSDVVKIIEMGQSAERFRLPLLALRRQIRRLAPDIVHTRGWSTIDAVFAAKLAGVPYVIHGEHGRDSKDTRGINQRRNQIRRVAGHLVDRYVVVCDYFRHWLHEACDVNESKIAHIPNGVDTSNFHPLEPELNGDEGVSISTLDGHSARSVLRQKLELPAEGILIGTVGRLDPVKDFPTLLKAYAQVRARHTNAYLVIVGDGPCRGELTSLAEHLGVAAQVHWLGERKDVAELLRCFDLFAQASLFEGMSNTILEAMASGLPVLTTHAGGNGELVKMGENGTLCPVGNVTAFAEAFDYYLKNEKIRNLHGCRSRSIAREKFDLPLMIAAYAALYEQAREKSRKVLKYATIRRSWAAQIKMIALRQLPEKPLQALKKVHYARVLKATTEEEVADFKVIQHLVGSGDLVLDVGANVGIYTKFLSGLVGTQGRVVSVEPIPLTYDILCANIKKLALANVEPINCAASDCNETVVMEVPLYEGGGENFYEAMIVNDSVSNGLRRVTVPARSIDSVFEANHPRVAFIKIDVEGNELRCLRGALGLVRRAKPSILIEVGGDPAQAGSQAAQTFKLLQDEGYKSWWFDGRMLHRWEPGQRSVNYFFLPSDISKSLRSLGLMSEVG